MLQNVVGIKRERRVSLNPQFVVIILDHCYQLQLAQKTILRIIKVQNAPKSFN